MPHRARIQLRRAADANPPHLEHDPAVVAAFLSDAAHVPGGHADAVTFPASESEVAALVAGAARVLPVGAQSSLTGGATPRGGVVLSTRALNTIRASASTVTVGAGVPLVDLQHHLAASGLWYPPAPTFAGAFAGGTVSTNAAGAATFKYGSTRAWVSALTVVLANGEVLDVERGEVTSIDNAFEIESTSGRVMRVPVPTYRMPDVVKLSAGYFARPGMDLVDLFVGSEGTLGVVVSATLRVVPRPRRSVALVSCAGEEMAIVVTAALRREAHAAWEKRGPLDIAAVEYVDARALSLLPDDAFLRAGVPRPADGSTLLFVQIEVPGDESAALERLDGIVTAAGVTVDPQVSGAGDERGAQRLLDLREAVPATVNAAVAAAGARVHPDIHKMAGDMVVPFDRLPESMTLYRQAFAHRGLDCAIWGHVSDGNLHPNVIPHAFADMQKGEDALLDIARGIIAMGGAPLAEHGVGRSRLKQRLLRELYGDEGVDQMRAVKRALDPEWKLAPGVIFETD